jgi:Tol biopolymer transport system component
MFCPRWAPNGKSIYFIGQDRSGLSGVFVQDFAPGRDTTSTRRPVAGFSPEYVTESLGLSPDGSRLTISTGEEFATIMLAEGVPGAIPMIRKSPRPLRDPRAHRSGRNGGSSIGL